MGKNRIIGGAAIVCLLGLATAYQNCGSGQGGSLNIGGGSNRGNSQNCTYGVNQQTGTCNPAPAVNSPPTYSCQIVPVGSSLPDPSRCTNASNCILACNETVTCTANSNIPAPGDSLVGCEDSSTNCNNGLNVDDPAYWQKYSTGNYNYNWANNPSNYAGTTDVYFSARVRDTKGQYSSLVNYTIKACNAPGGGSGATFGPVSVPLSCNAGNNQTNSASQTITLPAGAVASELRILTEPVVNSWTNNGLTAGQNYSYVLKASFVNNSLKLECNQVTGNVTFSVGTRQGGNPSWTITNTTQIH